ncbi:hypothetical protein SRHO_G00089250 [Serrasalmus rhombeus]
MDPEHGQMMNWQRLASGQPPNPTLLSRALMRSRDGGWLQTILAPLAIAALLNGLQQAQCFSVSCEATDRISG